MSVNDDRDARFEPYARQEEMLQAVLNRAIDFAADCLRNQKYLALLGVVVRADGSLDHEFAELQDPREFYESVKAWVERDGHLVALHVDHVTTRILPRGTDAVLISAFLPGESPRSYFLPFDWVDGAPEFHDLLEQAEERVDYRS